jgi:hypothetical protein
MERMIRVTAHSMNTSWAGRISDPPLHALREEAVEDAHRCAGEKSGSHDPEACVFKK